MVNILINCGGVLFKNLAILFLKVNSFGDLLTQLQVHVGAQGGKKLHDLISSEIKEPVW